MSITVKKLQIIPLGEKDERDRVWKYIKDGIYNQYLILNTYMSQVGTLYYRYNRDIKDANFKSEFNAIFRNTNEAIWDKEQAKGLGMAGNCGMRVKSDFSTAIKNGLARGERQLPFYKRDFPLLVPSRFLTFSKEDEEYTDDDGVTKERTNYLIKFVNGIYFKVVLGPTGKRDWFVVDLLEKLCEGDEQYGLGGSSIQIVDKKLILNLTVKIDKKKEDYEPVKGRVLGLSMGYDKCVIGAFSDSDKTFEFGKKFEDLIVSERIAIQRRRQELYREKRGSSGNGHGRKRRMRDIYNMKRRESNYVRYFNHCLSKEIVDFAKKNKVEAIVIESIELKDLKKLPVMLRNWSYYQLQNYIDYKAKDCIKVIVSDTTNARKTCSSCGEELVDVVPKEVEWCGAVSFTCPHCNKQIEYSFNKAKNISVNPEIKKKEKKGKKAKAKTEE